MQLDEYDLHDQRAAMAVLDAERKARGVPTSEIKKRHGVSMNSVYAWRAHTRTPHLQRFVSLATTLGFDVIMRRIAEPRDEYDLRDQRAAIAVLDAERKARDMALGDMEDKSGVSVNSVYAWRSCVRSPLLCNAVAIAETFGFEIFMRRRPEGSKSDAAA
ncbi:SIMPL domain-containing protein [Brucella intermedia]|uniref:SIMPL domain-containing protein n=1 Tax=Brucella intermedia TaxID=94625 RepID=UPI00235DEC0B|nr:hypothetical protein [Brucella intermedia]